ncbi:MAG TPA: VOC family protein [Sphingomicrobium sp.]|nr:VOC family protein [Sphingomicrobium sp.]
MTAPPFKLLGLDHLLLHVRGLAEAERFYCGVLGCSVQHRMPQHAMLELSAGVVLVDTADPNGAWAVEDAAGGRNVDHFAILTDGFDEQPMREWLAANAVPDRRGARRRGGILPLRA